MIWSKSPNHPELHFFSIYEITILWTVFIYFGELLWWSKDILQILLTWKVFLNTRWLHFPHIRSNLELLINRLHVSQNSIMFLGFSSQLKTSINKHNIWIPSAFAPNLLILFSWSTNYIMRKLKKEKRQLCASNRGSYVLLTGTSNSSNRLFWSWMRIFLISYWF